MRTTLLSSLVMYSMLSRLITLSPTRSNLLMVHLLPPNSRAETLLGPYFTPSSVVLDGETPTDHAGAVQILLRDLQVIHATSVEPETVQTTPGTAPPLTGRLVLYGDRQGKEWCAELDLKEYAFSALTLNP
jgi:hypothetical protein